MTSLTLPSAVPVIVLSHTVLFPNSLLPLHIFEERYRKMLRGSLDGARIFGVVQDSPQFGSPVPDLARVMGIGVIRACVERSEGTSDLILQGLARVRIVGESQSEPFRILEIETFQTEISNASKSAALGEKIKEGTRALRQQGYRMPEQMGEYLESVNDPEIIGDLVAATFVEDPVVRQEILEMAVLETRLKMILDALQELI